MDIDSLMDELGKRMDFGALKLDREGLCRIVFDERMIVVVECDRPNDVTCLHGVVTSQADCEKPEMLTEVLAANLLGVNSHDNYLALDLEQRELVLFSRLPAGDLDYESFAQRLEHFVNDLEHWMDRFEGAEVGNRETTRATHPADASEPAEAFGRLAGFRV